LCVALGPPYALWVKFALATGLKQAEQFTLRWRDVDLDRATLLVPHASTGGILALSMLPAAVALLKQLRQIHPPSMWVFPDLKNPYRAANVHSFYTGRWGAAVHRAGIAWCAWKDLRHTCGARLAKQGHAVTDILRVMRQRETRQAYTYRAYLAGRIGQPKTPLKPRDPIFAAEAVDGELRAAILRDLNNEPLTFKEGARLYAVHHLRRRPARRQFELMYQQYWRPWADRPLNSLQRREVRAWYSELAETPGAANKALTLLRSLYNWALDMESISVANPALRMRRFPETKRDRFLTVEELQRFMTGLAHVSIKARAYLLLILLTASRRSEARSIKWADIDEATRLWKKPRTKNGKSQFVPLPVQVLEALRALPRTSEYVFSGKDGQPWAGATAEKTWRLIRRRWGMEDVRLHDLRRTCASYLAMQGENLPTIQSVLNHTSLTPTAIYARLNTKAIDRALQAQADRFLSLLDAPVFPIAVPSAQESASVAINGQAVGLLQ
jgi:integrase